MPRYGPFIYQVHIADGFADDCDELVHRCLLVGRLTYHIFCGIWKDMKMGCLYEGRTLGAEIAELSEEVIRIGKHYMLKNTSNFEESVAGLFIVYALLNLQPYKGFAHLRIVPSDLPSVARIEHVARREKRLDVLYILASVLIVGPVHYHAAEREHGSDISLRKYLEGFTSIDKLGVRPKGVFYRQNVELDIMRELSSITQKYAKAKMAISEQAQFDRNLTYIDDNLPNELQTSLRKIINGIYEDRYGSWNGRRQSDDGDQISKSRRDIKDKAMKQQVSPVKHLETVQKRKTSPKNEADQSPEKKCGNKRKIKIEGAPTSSFSHRRKKRSIPVAARALKKNRFYTADTSESGRSDAEENEKGKGMEDIDIESIGTVEILQVDNEKKKKVGKEKEHEKKTDKESSDLQNTKKEIADKEGTIEPVEDVNKQVLEIEVDTLPVIIRNENQYYEIEIIDHMEEQPQITKHPLAFVHNTKITALKKNSKIPGVTIEKIDEPKLIDVVASTSTNTNDDNNLPKSKGNLLKSKSNLPKSKGKKKSKKDEKGSKQIPVMAKVEKRNCKRIHLKSKFKRLGMLHMAGFEQSVNTEEDEMEAERKETRPKNRKRRGPRSV